MLDKSIPYKNVIMEITPDKIAALPEVILPAGYRFSFFKEGDEKNWAAIETSVDEFSSEEEALFYFCRDYLPHTELLKERCLFILDPNGSPVATATAWFSVSTLGYQPSLHWVAACPQRQGLGLGRAVVTEALKIFRQSDPGLPVRLHTQTWSHRAIRLYHSLGFDLLRTGRLAVLSNSPAGTKIYPNDFDSLKEILAQRLERGVLNSLFDNAR